MLLNIILLLISSLLIYTTIFTLYIEVNYISVVATHLKTFFLIRGNKIPHSGGGNKGIKNCNDETYKSLLLKIVYVEMEEIVMQKNNEKLLKCSICNNPIEINAYGWKYGNNAQPRSEIVVQEIENKYFEKI